ncbi:MAG: polysaccharide pyruvyl transferase family protein [Bryobacteraceae bacterium]
MKGSALRRIGLLRNVHLNLGDEAMLSAEIALLREAFPGRELRVFTDDPEGARDRYQCTATESDVVLLHPFAPGVSRRLDAIARAQSLVAAAGRKAREKAYVPFACRRFLVAAEELSQGREPRGLSKAQSELLKQLSAMDLIVAGGSLVPSVPHTEKCRTAVLRALRVLNKPVILHGLSVFRRDEQGSVYHDCARIILRDPARSRQHAESCDIPAGRLLDGVDPALTLRPGSEERARSFLESCGAGRQRFAAVNLRSGAREQDLRLLSSELQRLARDGRFDRVLLFGMQHHPAEDDRRILSEFQTILQPLASTLVTARLAPELLKAVLALAEFAAVCRYHGAVFCLASAVPVLGLSVSSEYDLKLEGVYSMYERQDWFCAAGAFEPNRLRLVAAASPEDRCALAAMTSRLAPRQNVLIGAILDVLGLSKNSAASA